MTLNIFWYSHIECTFPLPVVVMRSVQVRGWAMWKREIINIRDRSFNLNIYSRRRICHGIRSVSVRVLLATRTRSSTTLQKLSKKPRREIINIRHWHWTYATSSTHHSWLPGPSPGGFAGIGKATTGASAMAAAARLKRWICTMLKLDNFERNE